MIKVSVIIPIYNGETYLRQCLDSVCNQTLREIEIICVDDGSTDSSFSILEEYKDKDNRIQIYRQKNLYAGVARNLGKSHAKGDYLVFWDCDDFFEATALEELYNQSVKTNADVCVCGANKYFNDTGKTASNTGGYLELDHVPGEVFNRTTNEDYIFNFTNAVPWNKMFSRQFIEDANLDFHHTRNGNDIYFTQCAIVQAERITTVDKALVNYRLNQGGSLFGTLTKSPLVPLKEWAFVAEHLNELGILPLRSFVNKAIRSIVYLLRNMQSATAFMEAIDYLKSEGLKSLCIEERNEDFYYQKWHCAVVNHLINDSPEDFCVFLAYQTYMQLLQSTAEKTELRKRISELEKIIYK